MDYKTRLVEEFIQLNDKILKLSLFLDTATFNELDFERQKLLRIQLNAMNVYRDVLELRIEKENIS